MLIDMQFHLDLMRPALNFAKIKDGHLSIPDDAKQLPVSMIREAFHWVLSLFECEYYGYKKMRDLCTEEIWERYLKWEGCEDFREVILLRKATHTFRQQVISRKRPNFFKKGKVKIALKSKVIKK